MVTGIYQEVELSLTENLIPVTVPVKQYDNKARKVRCVLYNNSVEYTVPQNCIVACSGTRPDGTIFHYTSETAPAVVFFYLANEGLSCLENAAVIGLPVPEKLKEMLAQLKDERDQDKIDKQ